MGRARAKNRRLATVAEAHGACFVIDGHFRVRAWPEAMAEAVGVSADEAVGAPCWRTWMGHYRRPASCRGCDPFSSQPPESAPTSSCLPLPLPEAPGEALVWVPPAGEPAERITAIPHLPVLGGIADLLMEQPLERGLELALELLRRACGADDCELFLREPESGALVLTVCRGADRTALLERERFDPGCGFPGLATERHEPLTSTELPKERRFLRRAVKDAGVRSYWCIPALGAGGCVGALGLAWHGRVEPDGHATLLRRTAGMIANAVLAARHRQRTSIPRAATEPMLELRCLGSFEVRLGGQPISAASFGRRKARTLLELLVLHAGNPMTRSALAEALWPGIDDKTGANRLHVTVHALRQAIEPFREARRWIFIRNQGDLYYFNMESRHRIDLYELRREVALARAAEQQGRPQEAVGHLERALDLHRGDLFEDDPDADWCEAERQDLRRRCSELARRLARLAEQTGDPDRAIAALQKGLEIEPHDEQLHRTLVEALLALGRRAEARQQYDRCLRMLREELEVEPLPETRRLESVLIARATSPSASRSPQDA